MSAIYAELIKLKKISSSLDGKIEDLTNDLKELIFKDIDEICIVLLDYDILEIELQDKLNNYSIRCTKLANIVYDVNSYESEEADIRAYFNDEELKSLTTIEIIRYQNIRSTISSRIKEVVETFFKKKRTIEEIKLDSSRIGWLTNTFEKFKLNDIHKENTIEKKIKATIKFLNIELSYIDNLNKLKGGYNTAKDKFEDAERTNDEKKIKSIWEYTKPHLPKEFLKFSDFVKYWHELN